MAEAYRARAAPESRRGGHGLRDERIRRAGARNRGLGTRLLAAARALAERERLAELFVWPSEGAVSLYRRAGYATSHELHELELIPDL